MNWIKTFLKHLEYELYGNHNQKHRHVRFSISPFLSTVLNGHRKVVFGFLFLKIVKNENKIDSCDFKESLLWKKKLEISKKCILHSKILFITFWTYILHMLSFHLRYMTLIYLRFSNFNHFLLEILHFLLPSFISQYHQKQRLRNNAFGVNRHLKIKKS